MTDSDAKSRAIDLISELLSGKPALPTVISFFRQIADDETGAERIRCAKLAMLHGRGPENRVVIRAIQSGQPLAADPHQVN